MLPNKDDVIRKVMITVVRDDFRNSHVSPITELNHLLDCEWYASLELIVDGVCLNCCDSLQLFSLGIQIINL